MITKYPETEGPYWVNWSHYLAAEDGTTIADSSWTLVEGDVELGANVVTGGFAGVQVTGGTAGTYAYLKNEIVTANGRRQVYVLALKVISAIR